MPSAIQFLAEHQSNAARRVVAEQEPLALRTYTPTQAVLAKSAGVFHWTPEGRRLYDYSSGVLVANLGHNPRRWMQRLAGYMGWEAGHLSASDPDDNEYFAAVPLTAYNAVTLIEALAVQRLLKSLRATSYGKRFDQIMWAASGSEAVQKALWACLHRDPARDTILATRHGFHGKKGLAGAVTGHEQSPDRDPRVKFISFPIDEIDDLGRASGSVELTRYRNELEALRKEYGRRLNCLITEPYLGGGGSYHPPKEYLQMLQAFCRENDILFILDEVQSNFGRTGRMYAFEKYEIEPDFVCLGKGLGNGIPVSAAAGRGDVMASLQYGEASDTWSASPLACASVVATLDEFETTNVLSDAEQISALLVEGLERLKETGIIAKVRGEGMVFGIEAAAAGDLSANQVANAIVETCYRGRPGGDGIHLLGALAGKVIRISPPMTITQEEARDSLNLLYGLISRLAGQLHGSASAAVAR